jgi:hypothetical protein
VEYTIRDLCEGEVWEKLSNKQLHISLSTIYSQILSLDFFNRNLNTQIFQEGFWVIDITDLEPTQIAGLSLFCLALSDHSYTKSWVITNGLEQLMQSVGFDNLDRLLSYDLDLRNVILRFSRLGTPAFLKWVDLCIFDTTRSEFDTERLGRFGIDHLQDLHLPILLTSDREPTVMRVNPVHELAHASILDKTELVWADYELEFEPEDVFVEEEVEQEENEEEEEETITESTVDEVELSTDKVNMVPILVVLKDHPDGLKLHQIMERVQLDVQLSDYLLQLIAVEQVREHNNLYFLEFAGSSYIHDLEREIFSDENRENRSIDIDDQLSTTLSDLRVEFNKGMLDEKVVVLKDLVNITRKLTNELDLEKHYYYKVLGLYAGLMQSAQEDELMSKRLSIKVGQLIVEITNLWDESLQEEFEDRLDDLSVESEGMDSDDAVDESFDHIAKMDQASDVSPIAPDELQAYEIGEDVGGWTPMQDLYDYSIEVPISETVQEKLKPDEQLFLYLLSHSIEDKFFLHDIMEYRRQIPMYLDIRMEKITDIMDQKGQRYQLAKFQLNKLQPSDNNVNNPNHLVQAFLDDLFEKRSVKDIKKETLAKLLSLVSDVSNVNTELDLLLQGIIQVTYNQQSCMNSWNNLIGWIHTLFKARFLHTDHSVSFLPRFMRQICQKNGISTIHMLLDTPMSQLDYSHDRFSDIQLESTVRASYRLCEIVKLILKDTKTSNGTIPKPIPTASTSPISKKSSKLTGFEEQSVSEQDISALSDQVAKEKIKSELSQLETVSVDKPIVKMGWFNSITRGNSLHLSNGRICTVADYMDLGRTVADRIKGLIRVKYIGKKSAEKISRILELFLESDNPLEWLNQEGKQSILYGHESLLPSEVVVTNDTALPKTPVEKIDKKITSDFHSLEKTVMEQVKATGIELQDKGIQDFLYKVLTEVLLPAIDPTLTTFKEFEEVIEIFNRAGMETGVLTNVFTENFNAMVDLWHEGSADLVMKQFVNKTIKNCDQFRYNEHFKNKLLEYL